MLPPVEFADIGPIAGYLAAAGRVRHDTAWCRIAAEHCDAIARAAAELLNCPQRLADLAHCSQAMFAGARWNPDPLRDIPRDDSQGERFFLIFPLLQRLDALRAWYRAHGIAEEVLRHTLYDFQLWIDTCRDRTGVSGFREAGWLRNHFLGRVFRLGRLQYEPALYDYPFVPLVRNSDGAVCLVARGGARITNDGVFADSEGARAPFTDLVYEESGVEVRRAHKVLPTGFIDLEPTGFAPGAWRRAVNDGDAVLSLHIPAGEPLDFDACRASLREAEHFFPRHFPALPPLRAVVCGSWLFYPGLCDLLPAGSNIVRFQRAFLRFPMRGARADQAFERVFVPHGRATTSAQLQGTLQRRLFAHVQEGHLPLAACGMMLPPFGRP